MTTRLILALGVLLLLVWVRHAWQQWQAERQRDDEGDVLWQMSQRVQRIRNRRRDG
jgi:hypothetical protein